jgi:hypothetical protein
MPFCLPDKLPTSSSHPGRLSVTTKNLPGWVLFHNLSGVFASEFPRNSESPGSKVARLTLELA